MTPFQFGSTKGDNRGKSRDRIYKVLISGPWYLDHQVGTGQVGTGQVGGGAGSVD